MQRWSGMLEARWSSTGVRALRVAMVALTAFALVVALAAAVGAKSSSKPAKSGTSTSVPVLATLKVLDANVTIKPAGKTKYVKAKDGQVLRQGDALSTDAAGMAEIDYTDGSLTRLSTSTQFKITKLTNKQGGRQTQGTLTVGDTWNRAAKVAQTGSFEVKAGGATAAVEGTAFAASCKQQGTQTVCTVIDVVDNVKMLLPSGGITQLTPATSVDVTNGATGPVSALSYDELANNPLVAGNLYLDGLAGKGLGGEDLPTTTTTTTLPQFNPPPTGQSTPIDIPNQNQNPAGSPSSVTTTLPEVPNVTAPPPPSISGVGAPPLCVPSNKNPC